VNQGRHNLDDEVDKADRSNKYRQPLGDFERV